MKKVIFLLLVFIVSCQQQPKTVISSWEAYDESEELAENSDNKSQKLRYKLIQSRVLDKNEIWKNVADQISNFSEEDYQALMPFILEQDIPTIQSHILSGELTYEKLTQWYLYRIVKYENDKEKMLNAIISLNPNAVSEARKRDKNKSAQDHPIYGMPILLKDNVNLQGLPTTAGTHLLRNNMASDAFIVERIKEKGGIILGKTNLSEWANFLCFNCPNGYSAIGGQTLNSYGRKKFDTGGSSSGSGAATAANYATAAIGTETSGSILSPSSTESNTEGWKIHLEVSTDLGKTWTKTGTLNDTTEFGAIQPVILNYGDGKLQLLSRTKNDVVSQNWSEDGGNTWSKMTGTSLPNPNSGIDGISLKDGRQLLIFNPTQKNWGNRVPLSVALSTDGKNWKRVLDLEPLRESTDKEGEEYSYPTVIQAQDDKIHIVYTWNRKTVKYVVLDPEKLK
jgi:amidase